MNNDDIKNHRGELPDWKCERFLLNELDDVEMEEIRRERENDERLRERLEALEQSNRDILREHPPALMAARIREQLDRKRAAPRAAGRRRGFPLTSRPLIPVALLAVIAMAVLVVPRLVPPGEQTAPDVVRIKGERSQLGLHRKTTSGSEQLQDGDTAAEHDLVLLQYQVVEPGYGVILSVDGRGAITRHLPERDSLAVWIEPGQPRFLDYAYELDDAPGWEVFVLVTAPFRFETERIARALEDAFRRAQLAQPDGVSGADNLPPPALELPEGFDVSTFTLIKESHHED